MTLSASTALACAMVAMTVGTLPSLASASFSSPQRLRTERRIFDFKLFQNYRSLAEKETFLRGNNEHYQLLGMYNAEIQKERNDNKDDDYENAPSNPTIQALSGAPSGAPSNYPSDFASDNIMDQSDVSNSRGYVSLPADYDYQESMSYMYEYSMPLDHNHDQSMSYVYEDTMSYIWDSSMHDDYDYLTFHDHSMSANAYETAWSSVPSCR